MKKIFGLLVLITCSVIASAQGIYQIWGVTPNGGSGNGGTLFSTNASGDHFLLRHDFQSYNPGAYPGASELVAFNGKFYGTTETGGSNDKGVIFEWDPASNAYTKKIDMEAVNGSNPRGSMSLYNGKFYGMAYSGGTNNAGAIYEWNPATNIYTKKLDLDASNGSNPNGSLTLSGSKFYGMTTSGGANSVGVIFEWDPSSHIYTKKIDLDFASGCSPQGNLSLMDGKFYGMTFTGGANNGGVIFEWDPASNIYSTKFDLDYATGNNPAGSLVLHDGKFYGLTRVNGFYSDSDGVLFEWDPTSNDYIVKVDFTPNGYGRHPNGNLVFLNGKFYGTTQGHTQGQNPLVHSSLFEWDPVTNDITETYNLTKVNGYRPSGSLAVLDNKLYGTTSRGGGSNSGVIFEWNPAGNAYAKKVDFNTNDGITPGNNLVLANDKFYGTSNQGGCDGRGVIFEWDRINNKLSKKLDLIDEIGNKINGSLVLFNGKYYGTTRSFGFFQPNLNPGIIEWDPVINEYNRLNPMDANDGYPIGSLTLVAGKFYGATIFGGANGSGVIYEWDPASNTYTKKFDFGGADGANPTGTLVLQDGKLYGLTNEGGDNNAGVLFEWNPATNIFNKKIDLVSNTGTHPQGTLTYHLGKFYGTTSDGGNNDAGVIFEWDPASNSYHKKFSFNTMDGTHPQGTLTVSNGRFYGMTNAGGNDNAGVLFEWDPASNNYTKKNDFDGVLGQNPAAGNALSLAPAPVANGVAGTCTSFSTITIDADNNNSWVPITDDQGNAVAEIKANGNNLGVVSTSMYINNGTVREDVLQTLYLDRNITITPQNQPSSAVDIRLYIKKDEYLALKDAVNSSNQPSGIADIADVGIFRNSDNCLPALNEEAQQVITTSQVWENGYALSASITAFSSFYFMNKANGGPVPISSMEFKGRLDNKDALLNWKTIAEINCHSYNIERSVDGTTYSRIATIAAKNIAGTSAYDYRDKNIAALSVRTIFYRVKQIDNDGHFRYSQIVPVGLANTETVSMYPNPVKDRATVSLSAAEAGYLVGRVFDNTGRLIMEQQWRVNAGNNALSLNAGRLVKGMYYLKIRGKGMNEKLKFIKE